MKTFSRTGPSLAALALVALALPGCGSKFDGTYEDGNGIMSVTFKPDHKVAVTRLGVSMGDLDYTVDGDKVHMKDPNGQDVTLVKKDDGSLQIGGAGAILKKKA